MESVLGAILLILVIGSFAAAVVRPWICFALLIAYPVVEQGLQGYFPFFVSNRSMFNFMIAGVVALTVAVRLIRDRDALIGVFNPVQVLGYTLLFVSYMSLLWTPELDQGLEFTFYRLPYTLLYTFLAPVLLSSILDFERLRLPLIFIASASLLLFLLSPVAQFYGTRLVIHYGMDQRGNAGVVGELGAIVLIFAALSNFRGLGKLGLPFQLAAGLFGLGMGLLSGARGQVLFGGLIAFLFYPLSRKIKDALGFFGLGFGIIFILGIIYGALQFFITDENIDRWTSESLQGGFGGRWDIVMEAFAPWVRNPMAWIFGRGAGAFLTENSDHVYPHNHPVEALTEIGFIGFTIYALMMIFTLKSALGLYRMYGQDEARRGSLAILFGLSLFCFLLSLKQGSVHYLGFLYVFHFLIAKIYVYECTMAERAAEIDDEFEEGDEEPPVDADHHDSEYSHA